jgi:hypothetical protein
MAQAIRCKCCLKEISDLDLGLCYSCEDILETEHDQAYVECDHGNDMNECKICEYEINDYVRQVRLDYERGVVR